MENVLAVLVQIESINNTESKKIKQKLIRDNYSHIFEYVLKLALDPFAIKVIDKIEVLENQPYILDYDITNKFKNIIDKILNIKIIDYKLREELFEIVNCSNYSFEKRKILEKIITKKLDVGISLKSINKAIGKKLISEPNIMLSVDKIDIIDKWNGIVCEEIYDTSRIICYISNGSVSFFTKTFIEIPSYYLEKIGEECLSLIKNSNLNGDWFFDGELMDMKKNGVHNKVKQMIDKKPKGLIGDDFIYNIFDLDEGYTLMSGIGIMPFNIRRKSLEGIFINNDTQNIRITESFLARNKMEVYNYHQKIINLGGKGIIMKNPEHVYECKRSKNWIKIKEFK